MLLFCTIQQALELVSAFDATFGINVLHMLFDCMIAYYQFVSYRLIGESLIQQLCHTMLRMGQWKLFADFLRKLMFLFFGNSNPVIPVDDAVRIALIIGVDLEYVSSDDFCSDTGLCRILPICRFTAFDKKRKPCARRTAVDLVFGFRSQYLYEIIQRQSVITHDVHEIIGHQISLLTG